MQIHATNMQLYFKKRVANLEAQHEEAAAGGGFFWVFFVCEMWGMKRQQRQWRMDEAVRRKHLPSCHWGETPPPPPPSPPWCALSLLAAGNLWDCCQVVWKEGDWWRGSHRGWGDPEMPSVTSLGVRWDGQWRFVNVTFDFNSMQLELFAITQIYLWLLGHTEDAWKVTHHVDLWDAVDALHLHINAHWDGCTWNRLTVWLNCGSSDSPEAPSTSSKRLRDIIIRKQPRHKK